MKLRLNLIHFVSEWFNIDTILFLVEFLLCIQPAFFNYINIRVVHIFLISFAGLEFVAFFSTIRRQRIIPVTELLIIAFTFFQLIVTVLYHSLSVMASIKLPLTVMLTVFAVMRRMRNNKMKTLHTLACFFWLVIAVNLATMLLFPNGLYHNRSVSNQWHTSFFFGVDNQFGKVFFPGIAIIWFDQIESKRSVIFTLSALLMIAYSYFSRTNGTGIITLAVFVLLYLIYSVSPRNILLSNASFIFIILVFMVGVVSVANNGFGLRAFNQLFAWLGKDATFSGRQQIWNICLSRIREHPWLGYGQQPGDGVIHMGPVVYSAHNKIIQTVCESGFVGLVLFGSIFLSIGRRSGQIAKQHPEIRILSIGIFATFIYFMMEVGTFVPLFMLLLVMTAFSSKVLDPVEQV